MKKYEEVYHDLEEKIKENTYPAGELLPSEKELAEEYQASRDTIRKALSLLMQAGIIQKHQGRGSSVIQRSQINFPVSGLTSYAELQKDSGFASRTKLVEMYQEVINDEVHDRTGLPVGVMAWFMKRIRYVDNKAVILDEDIFLAKYIPQMTKAIAEHSIYDYFENTVGMNIAYAEKEFTVVPLTELDREYLDLTAKDINVVCVKSHVYLSNSTLFQFTESRHQVDKFRFVDFARRSPVGKGKSI